MAPNSFQVRLNADRLINSQNRLVKDVKGLFHVVLDSLRMHLAKEIKSCVAKRAPQIELNQLLLINLMLPLDSSIVINLMFTSCQFDKPCPHRQAMWLHECVPITGGRPDDASMAG